MKMGISGQGILKGVLYTAIALILLGLIKVSMPTFWAKIPGLKEF